jgi:GcrA cell cycle regulator
MPATEPTWTDERVERLKAGFAAKLSCREIAADIGVSRNAVIGKLARLNLTRGKSIRARRHAGNDAARGPGGATVPRGAPRLQQRILLAFCAEPEPAADDEPITNGHCCSLLELSDEKCRWPISSPGLADFCFCGNPPLEGLPYCPGHTRLAYRPGSRQRVARG